MNMNDKNLNILFDKAVEFSNFEELLLSRRENGLLLSDYQVDVLNRNGIDYKYFSNIKDLMFEIENCLDEEFDEELDLVSSQLSEYIYYNEFKK